MIIGAENIDFGEREAAVQSNFDAFLKVPEVGENLALVYAHALKAAPFLAEVDLVLSDEAKYPALKYTVGGVRPPEMARSGRWEVVIHGDKDIEGYKEVMGFRKVSARIMGEKCGLPEPMDPVQFAAFCTAHDFGHPLHCEELGDSAFFRLLRNELNRLPVPGMNPAEVLMEIDRLGGADEWAALHSGILASSGCVDVEELIEAHDGDYRAIATEDYADQFAVRVMKQARLIH
jgi:hypothetical protein